MADDRLRDIKVDAGLDDSKLNTEFIDFIGKWGPRAMLLAAAGFLIYWALGYRTQLADERLAGAFAQLDGALQANPPSPDSLTDIADSYSDLIGVASAARLAAADVYLGSVRTGMFPGSPLNADGTPENDEDILTEEDVDQYLGRANALYQQVWDSADKSNAQVVHAFSAGHGLAAVAEARGDRETSERWLRQVSEIASDADYVNQVRLATWRINTLDERMAQAVIYDAGDLPEPPPEPETESPTELSTSLDGFTDVPFTPVDESGASDDPLRLDFDNIGPVPAQEPEDDDEG
ncbi:MAG: hypothetical protein AAF747_03095 [Planctomycetota bacterium]